MAEILLVSTAGAAAIHFFLFHGKSCRFDVVYFLIMLIIMGFCSRNIDYLPYEQIYENIRAAAAAGKDIFVLHADKGFVLANYAGACLDWDYPAFRFWFLAVPLLLMFHAVKCMGVPVCGFFLLYLAYPFFMDAIQIRNFFIESILFFCVYLYARGRTQDFIGIFVFLGIALSLQPLVLAYTPFFLFYELYKREKWRCIPQFFVILGLLGIQFRELILEEWIRIGQWLASQGDVWARAGSYMGRSAADSRFLKLYAVILLLTILLYYAKRQIEQESQAQEYARRFIGVVYQLYLYTICFFPLFVLDINFATRFPRNLLPLAYGAILLFLPYVQVYWRRNAIMLFMLFLAIYFGLVDLYIGGLRSQVGLILDHNILLDVFP